VLRSLRRACDGVAERHGRRAAGALLGCRRSSAFWRLGRPKTHHEIKDSLISGILVMKSQAWADPSLWDDPEFEQVQLKLETIEDQCLWHFEQDQ